MPKKRTRDQDTVTVKFLEDDVEYTCRKERLQAIPTKPGYYNVLWKDGRRYEAVVIGSFASEPSIAPLDEHIDYTESDNAGIIKSSCEDKCDSLESSNNKIILQSDKPLITSNNIAGSFNNGENCTHNSLEGESSSSGAHTSFDQVLCDLSVCDSQGKITTTELCASDGVETEHVVLQCENLNLRSGLVDDTTAVPITNSIIRNKQNCAPTNDVYDFQPCTPERDRDKLVTSTRHDTKLQLSSKGRSFVMSNVDAYSDESSSSGEEYRPPSSDEYISDSESGKEDYEMCNHERKKLKLSCISHTTQLISDRNTKVISTNESQSPINEKSNTLQCNGNVSNITEHCENVFDNLLSFSNQSVIVTHTYNADVYSEKPFKDLGEENRSLPNKETYSESGSDTDSYIIPQSAPHYFQVSPSNESTKESAVMPTNAESLGVENCTESDREMTFEAVTGINVKKCTTTAHGKRKYDKVHYCLYCTLPQLKIARHLERKHKDEAMVSNALKLPVNSKERKQKLEELRNRGDFKHNESVLKSGKGEIVTLKSLSVKKDYSQYLACTFCGALCLKKILWKHERQCSSAPEGTERKLRHRKMASAMMTSSIPTIVDDFRVNVLTRMHLDAITLAVKNDSLILKYGENMYEQFKHDPSNYNYVSQKLRELGRFLLALKSVNKSVKSMSETLVPQYYNDVLAAVRLVAEYDGKSNKYKIPSLALKLQTSINVCAFAVKSQAFIDGDDNLADKVTKFQELLKMNYTSKVSKHALRTLETNKWNKPLILPVTADIVKLHEYLQVEGDKLKKELETKPSTHVWNTLNKVVLTSVILFNRRRDGEASKVFVETFTKHVCISPLHEDIKKSLSSFEQKLVTSLARIEIRGKHGRRVPLLLTSDIKNKLNLLVKTRTTVGVAKGNPYLFARPYENSLNYIRGHDCIREFAKLCGAKEASAISSTKLRKHVATISQIVNLKDNEMDILAGFLGHDIMVHREFYRLPEATLQVAKIGKILLGLEKGLVQEFKGKTLDEITINDCDEVEADETDGSVEIHETIQKKSPSSVNTENNKTSDLAGMITENGNDFLVSSNSDEVVIPSGTVSNDKKRTADLQKKNKQKIRHQNRVQPWTESEKNAVTQHMKRFLVLNKVPGKKECEECIDKYEVLQNREWRHIKYFVYNLLKSSVKKN